MSSQVEAPNGREMKDLMIERGVFSGARESSGLPHSPAPCNLMVKRPRTGEWAGHYVADFGDMEHVCDSSKSWKVRLERALPGAKVVLSEDITAKWRVGMPVIHATIIFQWSPAMERAAGRRKRGAA